MVVKTCRNCGVLYDESFVKFKNTDLEFDGWGRVLCLKCRHNRQINGPWRTF